MNARARPTSSRFIRRPWALTGVLAVVLCLGCSAAEEWQSTQWRNEPAYTASGAGWRAIVSVARARLVHLGPADSDLNLLFETADPEDRQGWGGHRVWLGPQGTWPSGWWPPPPQWERAPAESVEIVDGRLELAIPAVGEGWPTFRRTYHWADGRLICGISVAADGTKDAQVVQILQVPTSATVKVRLVPDDRWPQGYVGLPAGSRRVLTALTEPPAHAAVTNSVMLLRHIGVIEKLGFRPQPLQATVAGWHWSVDRGAVEGDVAGAPDAGFYTQVYLGSPDTFIELEQLSPLWRAGTAARFEMVIEPQKLMIP